jgi:two-component system CheB/CheR fusion protein
MGYSQADVIGKNFIEFVYEDDRSRLIERFFELNDGIEYPFDYRLISKSGDIIWVRTKTKPLMEGDSFNGARGTLIDITDRKQEEAALRESEERFRSITESLQEAVWYADLSGKFIFLSPIMAHIYGRPLSDMKANPDFWVEASHPENQASVLASKEALLRDDHAELEYRIILPDSTVRWIADRKLLLRNEHGEPCQIAGIVSDITERKQAEEKIQASLLEKETMLKEIHHRVKNNLQVISSLLNIQSSHLQDEKAKEALQESIERVGTMASIHTQLYESEDLTRIDFGSFIGELIGNIRQVYGRAESPVGIKVDADEISLGIETSIPCGLILNELVSNALKHAFPEGRKGELHIRMRSEDKRMTLTVQDNGIGFPESIDLTKLKSLGMDLVNILVRQMKGKMDMRVDGGTTWTITFPVKDEREWQNG